MKSIDSNDAMTNSNSITHRKTPYLPPASHSWLPIAIGLLVFAAGFRLLRVIALPDLPNFSPVMAIAFCGAWFLPGALALILPILALLISDIALSAHYASLAPGIGDLLRYACYAAAAFLGWSLRRNHFGGMGFWAGVLGSAVAFYLVTNSAAWLGNPLYPQSLVGWIQSLTVGLPGYPPTWTFFRNSLASDLLFSGAMVAAAAFVRQSEKSRLTTT